MRIALVATVFLVGCSGSSSGSSASGIDATCGDAKTSVIDSALDGQTSTVRATTRSWRFLNFNPATFDGSWDGGSTHLEWAVGTTPEKTVTEVAAGTVTPSPAASASAFRSGQLVYDSTGAESVLQAKLTFETGTVTVCMRK